MRGAMSKKLRLDRLLVAKGLFASREQAQRAVMAGEVKVGTRIAAKPSQLLEPDVAIAVKPTRQYVGRGALKLEGALNQFGIEMEERLRWISGPRPGVLPTASFSEEPRKLTLWTSGMANWIGNFEPIRV